jgi:putative sterol carrier protein
LTYFKDSQEVYDTVGKLFVWLTEDPELASRFRTADTIVRYEYTEPDSAITVRLKIEGDDEVDFGESELEPEVTMRMKADTAHRFWLGKVNVTMAIARGEIKPEGPVSKILKLVPLTKPIFPRYRSMLQEEGRQDLLDIV